MVSRSGLSPVRPRLSARHQRAHKTFVKGGGRHAPGFPGCGDSTGLRRHPATRIQTHALSPDPASCPSPCPRLRPRRLGLGSPSSNACGGGLAPAPAVSRASVGSSLPGSPVTSLPSTATRAEAASACATSCRRFLSPPGTAAGVLPAVPALGGPPSNRSRPPPRDGHANGCLPPLPSLLPEPPLVRACYREADVPSPGAGSLQDWSAGTATLPAASPIQTLKCMNLMGKNARKTKPASLADTSTQVCVELSPQEASTTGCTWVPPEPRSCACSAGDASLPSSGRALPQGWLHRRLFQGLPRSQPSLGLPSRVRIYPFQLKSVSLPASLGVRARFWTCCGPEPNFFFFFSFCFL